MNFGIRNLQERLTPETLAIEIARYDAEDAREVFLRIRAMALVENAVDELLTVYDEVLSEHQHTSAHDVKAEGRATAT